MTEHALHALWDDWLSAEVYREYVESYPLYRALNRHLSKLADLGRARRVLDLGCGTGATTAACLERLPDDGQVLALDSAAAMVEVARCRVSDPRANFLCCDVSDLSRLRLGRFDRAVCNAASWLFPSPASVLADLRDLLESRGLLVFNLPAERVEGKATDPHPFQIELGTSLIAQQPDRRPPTTPLFDPSHIETILERLGFRIEWLEIHSHIARQEELMALMHIPAMAARLVPHLDLEVGLRIVRSAASRSDPDLEVEVPWVYFVARRMPSPEAATENHVLP